MMKHLLSFSWADIFAPTIDFAYQIQGALRSQLVSIFVAVVAIAMIVFMLAGLDQINLITGINVFFSAASLTMGVFMASIPIIFQPAVLIAFVFSLIVLKNFLKERLQLCLQGITTNERSDSPKAWAQRSTFKRLSEKQKEEYREKATKKYKCRYRLWITLFCGAFVGSLVFLAVLGKGFFPIFVEVFGGDVYRDLLDNYLRDRPAFS